MATAEKKTAVFLQLTFAAFWYRWSVASMQKPLTVIRLEIDFSIRGLLAAFYSHKLSSRLLAFNYSFDFIYTSYTSN